MRVAALIDAYQVSGPGRQLAAATPILRAAGVEVEIVMFHRKGRPESPFKRFLDEQGHPHWIIDEGGRADFGTIRQFAQILKAREIDLVQTHGYKPNTVACLARYVDGYVKAKPWLAFFHGSTQENLKVRLYNALDRRLFPRADHVVVMSKAHEVDLRTRCKSVSVVHNAVLEGFDDIPVTPRHASAGNRRILLCAGRLSYEKGVDVLLRAMAAAALPGVELRIVGDGLERASLELDVQRLGLSKDVTFLGHIEDMQEAYTQADILVIPSRSEGLPNVLLESLRFELPIVATRVGAIPEVLEGFPYARLCTPDSVDSLRVGLEQVVGLRKPGDSTAYRDLRRQFDIQGRCAKLVDLYHGLVSRRS